MSEINERFKAVPEEGQVVMKVFEQIDFDNSGEVDKSEFISFFKALKQKGKTEEEIQHFIDMINKKVYVAVQQEAKEQALQLSQDKKQEQQRPRAQTEKKPVTSQI